MKHFLDLCYIFNSPFSTAKRRFHNGYDKGNYTTQVEGGCGSMSSNSTPYSQVSVPSSYDYEDDFTSDEESEASVVHGSVNNAK